MANTVIPKRLPVLMFLNHLCDGEPCEAGYVKNSAFLNHLCDGELAAVYIKTFASFLNHLCDGEP